MRGQSSFQNPLCCTLWAEDVEALCDGIGCRSIASEAIGVLVSTCFGDWF